MPETSKLVDFLNSLIRDQPNLVELLDQGIPANEAICKRTDIFTRPVGDENNITVTGILVAIAKQYEEQTASMYNDSGELVGFAHFVGRDEQVVESLLGDRQEKVFKGEEFNELAARQSIKESLP